MEIGMAMGMVKGISRAWRWTFKGKSRAWMGIVKDMDKGIV